MQMWFGVAMNTKSFTTFSSGKMWIALRGLMARGVSQ
jgi:hypothetical protein